MSPPQSSSASVSRKDSAALRSPTPSGSVSRCPRRTSSFWRVRNDQASDVSSPSQRIGSAPASSDGAEPKREEEVSSTSTPVCDCVESFSH